MAIVFALAICAMIMVARADHLLEQCRNATSNGLCPASFQGFQMFCNATNLDGARQLCRQNNMQLAIVNEQNSGGALQTQQWCSLGEGLVWVESYNGLSGGPCMVQVSGGLAVALAAGNCQQQEFPVMCQRIPQDLTTLTSTISKTMWTGVDYQYVTVTPTICNRKPHHHKSSKINPEPKVFLQDAAVKKDQLIGPQAPNFIPPSRPCGNTCAVPESRFLRMSLEAVPFSMAEAACKRHGWRLADFTTGMSAQVGALLRQCSAAPVGWIRSFEGVDGASCLFASTFGFGPASQNDGVQGSFGYSVNACNNLVGPVYPICDIRCQPARTGFGPIQGTTTSFTSVTRTTTWTSVPLSVETVTVTQWPKHDPKNPRCCCRSCHAA